MVGSAILRKLNDVGQRTVVASRNDVDLTSQSDVNHFFNEHNFDQVYLAAAKVGGIQANMAQPVGYLDINNVMGRNVIMGTWSEGVRNSS